MSYGREERSGKTMGNDHAWKARKNRPRLTLEDVRNSGITRGLLLALHEAEGVGDLAICHVVQYGINHPLRLRSDVGTFRERDWREMGLAPSQCEAVIASIGPEAHRRRIRRCRDRGIGIMTFLDERYPPLLREIADPPWILYYRGNWELAHKPAVAIVGTRQATAYGRKIAEDLAAGCARRVTIVSGLARGIDSAAHRGALRGECRTIAVLATPVDVCYPPENQLLYDHIVKDGLILSETPPEAVIHPAKFPMRNRIIAGLSMGVVVVEAARRSGALITADLAIDYDRDVFVVPGPISSPRSSGALEYFRKGAEPVLDESDIFQAYKHRLPKERRNSRASDKVTEPYSKPRILSNDERAIYDLIADQPRSIDELAEQSGMQFGLLQSVLLSLMIKRTIQQQPGSIYKVL
ncbi:DNA-processing protein DprA [Cohnella panacarvi]|uniref:DNA-processing protein DprA n=1 Tax=Cohnella panacarvi TaxID=400776 RepID=UPI00047A24E4|nr:DNA-processing protein DprA [Cohnella panacarvi]